MKTHLTHWERSSSISREFRLLGQFTTMYQLPSRAATLRWLAQQFIVTCSGRLRLTSLKSGGYWVDNLSANKVIISQRFDTEEQHLSFAGFQVSLPEPRVDTVSPCYSHHNNRGLLVHILLLGSNYTLLQFIWSAFQPHPGCKKGNFYHTIWVDS